MAIHGKVFTGRRLHWATLLSPVILEIHQVERDEDGLSLLRAASIPPRENLDEIPAELVPNKSPGQQNSGKGSRNITTVTSCVLLAQPS